MKTLAKVSLALATMLCPLAGLAQNDPDTDITYHLVDPRDRYANKLTQMDMDIDEQGNLVVAYIIESFYPASLGIAVRDTSGGWRVQEVLSLGQRGDYGTVKHLTMSVASGINGETKVAVALVFDPESNQRLQPWQRKDEVWIYEGPIGRAWTQVEKTGTRMASEPQFAVSDATFAHPWISYLSSSRGSFADYVLGVAWTSRGGDIENPPGVKIRFYRQDELDHVRLEQLKQKNLPPYYKPEIFQVAGRGGVLTGSTFGRPSLTMDLNQGVLGIAVENVGTAGTMVLSGSPPARRGDALSLNVVSTTGAMQPCIRPMIVARDAAASLACLGAEVGNSGSYELRLFYMDLLNPGSDRFISRVHPQCRSRADVAVIRDNAYITAECLEGEGWPVFAFEGERDDAARAPTGGPISDKPTNPTQPQAAATLRSTQPRYWLYGWPTNEFFPYGSGPPYVSVFLDE